MLNWPPLAIRCEFRRFALLLFLVAPLGINAAAPVQFHRDIRPLLADNCFACHGPDNNARKAGLRLDTRDGLYESTPKRGPAVVAKSLEKSELWNRIITTDPDNVMPPPKSHKILKPEQKELFKQWILSGAAWQGHWAYLKPERPSVPNLKGASATWVRNPIDAFVMTKLESQGLTPNHEADRRQLARRAALDLTGLPPRPDVVEAYAKDGSPTAYEKLVKQLMNSPAWGEHRARYWLDAARYADTHGLHFDNYREMWPYRDWVIQAFNRNVRFNQFTIDQLAGDLLPDPTDDQVVATGFQRCNITTNEGGTIEEENLANYANDRVATTGWVFLGATLSCCACHDHKFDPFTTRDFYSMAAFYRNTKQTGFDKNIRESDLFRVVPQTESDRSRWKTLPELINAAVRTREIQAGAAELSLTNWLNQTPSDAGNPRAPQIPREHVRVLLNDGAGTNVAAQIDGAEVSVSGPTQLEWMTEPGPWGSAPLLDKTNTFVVGDAGDFEVNEPFSFGAWVLLPKDFKGEGSILARMGGEEENYRGWELQARDEDFVVQMIHRWSNNYMSARSSGKAVKRGEWQHLFVTYDGSGRTSGLKLFVNGVEVNANRDANRLEGTIRSPFPLRIGRREKNSQVNRVAVQDVRIHRGRLSSVEVAAIAAAPRVSKLLAKWNEPVAVASPEAPAEKSAPKGKTERELAYAALRAYYLVSQDAAWPKAQEKLAALEAEQALIRGRSPVTLVQAEKSGAEAMAKILYRGQYDQPKENVPAATPAALHTMPTNAPRNRLGLSQWIVSPNNPLTARVTVNRFWQEVFGVGLVRTVDDFGTTSESPANQDLLDWLAVEFVESGWDVKHLFELMVTSSTYRQSAEATPEKLEKDPQNRWLSRGPRFRMDAEMVRDCALAASDLLVQKIGGPSVKPYQPSGVWEAVAMPESNTRLYERDSGSELYRRSLYTFWKRAAPPAMMDIFNAPSREVCTVRRERTNTPLQALATLNDTQFVEAARHLAEVALTRRSGDAEAAIQEMAARLLSRPLTSQEMAVVQATFTEMLSFYEQEPESAQQLVRVGESKPPASISAPKLAAMTMVANQLLNLDEVLNK